ncbi:MAG: phosphoribosylformylglycinamidine synthase subunit PurQ [Rickettsiales bacterium]|nr:phosphoribosylformylglycinamidine synthase subunit PurQ [Rickettsiales bacterium]
MKSAVIVFPASNCDRDAKTVLAATGLNPAMVWHRDTSLPKVDLVMLPGGFSYGDYLRSGAMAAHSPIMREVKAHAERGGLVLGVCNGFQVLTEAGMVPGVLMRNKHLKFVCREVYLKVESSSSPFTKTYKKDEIINVPVAHHDGNYYADVATLKSLEDRDQIAFRYCDMKGAVTEEANPNGSQLNIAGVFNEKKNVLGMMPHPERHAENLLGGSDGKRLFDALLAA